MSARIPGDPEIGSAQLSRGAHGVVRDARICRRSGRADSASSHDAHARHRFEADVDESPRSIAMIYLGSLQDHVVGIARLIEGLQSEIRSLRHVTYERLFYSMKAPVGHYVFTDIDRLSHYEKETVIGLADALRRAHPAVRILNDPRKVLERYPLIRLLAEKGLNRFGATRLDDGSRPSRYPVFIRCEDSHHGADTDLLHSPEELECAIADLAAQGKVL